ncbi:MAG TPA: GNVR domain-containing protein, partial [Telluria sp.]|nr:GNVR domain-containing protein [Telluria sp.]
EKGIVSLDFNRVDVELARLNDLSQQLVATQGQVMEADSRARMASGAAVDSPDVANNTLIQNMRVALATAEARFSELSQRLAPHHPAYISGKAEVDKMRADLNIALGAIGRSVGNNAAVLRQRESDLRGAVAAQKVKVLELNRARDEFGVLLKDMDSAQRAFDAASQRLSQTKIEASSEQSDISILNPAVPPVEPSAPRVLLNTLVSVLLGTVLGVGLALLIELLKRPVRSAADMQELLGVPVLGTVEWRPPRPRAPGLRALMAPRRLRVN